MQLYYFGLLIVVLTGCECHFRSDLYVIDNAFADQICPADQIEFQTVAGNVISCLRRCAESSGCRSLVYLDDNKACYGIKSDNPCSMSSPLPGAVFYWPGGSLQMTTSTQSTPGITGGSTVGSTTQGTTTTTTMTTTATAQATTPATTSTTTSTAETTITPTTTIASTPTTTPTTIPTTTSPTTTNTTTTTKTTTTTTTATTPPTTTTTLTTTIGPGTPMVIGVADSQLTASSNLTSHPDYAAKYAKLNNTFTGWAAETGYLNTEQYIQVDFLHQVQATFVITKGILDHLEWVSSYKVLTSTDCSSFVAVQDNLGNDMIFMGNKDSDSEVMNAIVPPVVCRCFRINPQTWNVWITLRFEVLGHVMSP